MESFSEERFPIDIAYGISGGPSFRTDVITTSSGYEYRNITNMSPRYQYQLASAIKTEEQLNILVSFFKAMKGRAIGFRFKDWLDYKVHDQRIAIADGHSLSFQLTKHYKTGVLEATRKLIKPVKNTVRIFINSVEQKNVKVNYTNGIVTFASAPQVGSQIFASFEFDVPVRFDNDTILTTMQGYGVQLIEEITLIEVYK